MEFADAKVSAAAGGTVIHVMPGTYTFGNFTTRRSGTPTARITWLSEVRWAALLTHSGWTIRGAYTDLDGFEIGPDPGAEGGWGAIDVEASNVRVIRNYVHNKGDDQRLYGNCPGAGAIYIGAAAHDVLIDANVIYSTGRRGGCQHTWGYSTSNHGIYVAGYHNTVTNNVVSKAAGWGIHMDHNPCQNVIANNTVFYNFTGGIYIGNTPDGIPPCTVTGDDHNSIINNLVIHNGWGSKAGGNRHGMDGIVFAADIGPHNKVFNNLLAGNLNTGGSPSNSIINLSTQPLDQGGNINHGMTYTELFVRYRDEYSGVPSDYGLSPASAALAAGANQSPHLCAPPPGISPCIPAADFDGNMRSKERTGIGAFEN